MSPSTLKQADKAKLLRWATEHHMPSEPGVAFERWLDALQGVDEDAKAKALALSRASGPVAPHDFGAAEARFGVLGLFVFAAAAILAAAKGVVDVVGEVVQQIDPVDAMLNSLVDTHEKSVAVNTETAEGKSNADDVVDPENFSRVVTMLNRERDKGMTSSIKELWSFPPKMYDVTSLEDQKIFHQKRLADFNTAMQQYINTNTPSKVRQLFLMTVVGDTLKTNPAFLAEYQKGNVSMEAIRAEMATVARNTGASGPEQNNAALALFQRLQNNPDNWTGSRDLMGTVDNLETFLDTVALMAENQLAMNTTPDNVFVETQAALWLSTKAGDILEKIAIGSTGAEEMARILRENQAGESSRQLLLDFLERMNPRFEIPAISRLYASISNKRSDKLATLLKAADGLRRTFSDSRRDILNRFETATSNNNWDQTQAWLKQQYENKLLQFGFAIISTVAVGTTVVACASLWALYKVTLGRFGTKSKEEVDDVIAGGRFPVPHGNFYTKKSGGRTYWAQIVGKNGMLRKCIRKGDRWAQGLNLIRTDDPDYVNWKLTHRE